MGSAGEPASSLLSSIPGELHYTLFFFSLFNAKWREQTPTTVFFPLRLSLLHVVHHSGEKPKHKIEQLIEVASKAWDVLNTVESILYV